jgi:prefoldin subunit 5
VAVSHLGDAVTLNPLRFLESRCQANRQERAAIAAEIEHVAATTRTVSSLRTAPSLLLPLSGGKGHIRASLVAEAPLLALLGDNYFRECTPEQATALLQRRVALMQSAIDELDAAFAALQSDLDAAKLEAASSANEPSVVDFAAPENAAVGEIGGSGAAAADHVVEHDVAYNHPPLPFSEEELARRRAADAALIAAAFDRFSNIDESDVDVARLGPLVPRPEPAAVATAVATATATAAAKAAASQPSPLSNVVVERRANSTAPVAAAAAGDAAPAPRVSLFKQRKK